MKTRVLTWNSLQTQPPMERGKHPRSSEICIWQSVYRRVSRSDPLRPTGREKSPGVGRWKDRALTCATHGGEKNLHTRRGMVEGPCAHEWRFSCAFLLHRCRHVFAVVATVSVALAQGISTSTSARISLPLGRDSRRVLNAHISLNLRMLGLLDVHDS